MGSPPNDTLCVPASLTSMSKLLRRAPSCGCSSGNAVPAGECTLTPARGIPLSTKKILLDAVKSTVTVSASLSTKSVGINQRLWALVSGLISSNTSSAGVVRDSFMVALRVPG